MKKYYFFLILITVLISSCEKDDFCIDPITPNMVIRFYDATNPTETKSVEDLIITLDSGVEVENISLTDSIIVPLDVTSNQTIFNFTSGTEIDQVIIDYTLNEVFVSRSCGFKATFSNVISTPQSSNWIQYISQSTTIIEDESAAHIQIFH